MSVGSVFGQIARVGETTADIGARLNIPIMAQIDGIIDSVGKINGENDKATTTKKVEELKVLIDLSNQLAATLSQPSVPLQPAVVGTVEPVLAEKNPMDSKKFIAMGVGILTLYANEVLVQMGMPLETASGLTNGIVYLVMMYIGAQGAQDAAKAIGTLFNKKG